MTLLSKIKRSYNQKYIFIENITSDNKSIYQIEMYIKLNYWVPVEVYLLQGFP